MYKVEGTKITMTRGDTLKVQLSLKQGEDDYTPVEGDALRFAVKSRLNSKRTEFVEDEPLIEVAIPMDTLLLQLDPEDTKDLKFGNYYYDIEFTSASGDVDTVVPMSPFILDPEVD